MKQSDLVEKTKIGKSSISTYISGAYEPKQRNIYKIAKALDVSEAWLMGFDVPMERDSKITEDDILNSLPPDVREVFEMYLELDEETQGYIKGLIKSLKK